MFDSDGSYVLNKPTTEVNWLREEKRKLHAGHVGRTCIMAATRNERHDEGFYEASLANRNRRVSPINSDGVDTEGRREAGQADDEDKCRVVRSRDLALLASEISEPRNEMTEEERDDDASADMCQPSNEEAPIRRPRNLSEPTPEEREKHWAVHLPCRSWCLVCVKARGREDPHRAQRERGKPTWNCLRSPWTTLR